MNASEQELLRMVLMYGTKRIPMTAIKQDPTWDLLWRGKSYQYISDEWCDSPSKTMYVSVTKSGLEILKRLGYDQSGN